MTFRDIQDSIAYSVEKYALSVFCIGTAALLLTVPVPGMGKSVIEILLSHPFILALLAIWYIGRSILALDQHRRHRNIETRQADLDDPPSVSVLIPAYNEAASIADTIAAINDQQYRGDIEIVVVDDGSTDDTWDTLQWLSGIHDNLRAFTQENTGQGGARNHALSNAQNELVVSVDADTVLDDYAIAELAITFRKNPDAVAVGGNIGVLNDEDGWVARTQLFDYALSMELGRMYQARLGYVLCLSGAFSSFDRRALQDISGWNTDPTIADDFEVSIRMHQHGSIAYAPTARAYTDVPTTVRGWFDQRTHWAKIGITTMVLHWRSNLNPDYGMAGLVGLPIKGVLTIGLLHTGGVWAWTIVTGQAGIISMATTAATVAILSTTALSLFMVGMVMTSVRDPRSRDHPLAIGWYAVVYRYMHTAARVVGSIQGLYEVVRTAISQSHPDTAVEIDSLDD